MKTKIIALLLMLLVSLELCSGCSYSVSSFGIEEAEGFFFRHETDLMVLVEFLENQDYKQIFISRSDGTALADLKTITIQNSTVIQSLEAVMGDGCRSISKNADKNSIQFVLWTRTRDEADSGLLFPLTREKDPEAQFQTELIPMNNDGWYYYLAEYNKWRIKHTEPEDKRT